MDKMKNRPAASMTPDIESRAIASDTDSITKPVAGVDVGPEVKPEWRGFKWPNNWFFRTYRRRWITIELSLLLIIGIIAFSITGTLGLFGRPQKQNINPVECASYIRSADGKQRCVQQVEGCTSMAADRSTFGGSEEEQEAWSKLSFSSICVSWPGQTSPESTYTSDISRGSTPSQTTSDATNPTIGLVFQTSSYGSAAMTGGV